MIIDGGYEPTYEEYRAKVVKEQEEEFVKLSFMGKVGHFFKSLFSGPRHIEVDAWGYTADECLGKLERKAGLPNGDLSLNGNKYECANLWTSGIRHFADSKTDKEWSEMDVKPGYVSASVYEIKIGMTPLDGSRFVGFAHVSRNCPGISADGRCTYCGHTFRG